MIDIKTGTVSFNNLKLHSFTSILSLASTIKIKPHDFGLSNTTVSLGIHFSGKQAWGVGVVFSGVKLLQIWLQFLDEKDASENIWTMGNERERKNFHDAYLKEMVMGRYKKRSNADLYSEFSWGNISSILDVRGVQALILIEYI
ncbi:MULTISPECIES: hypothetical protein [unclassified Janthinobacterium]|uniref:hypothetical protein n=1 Tax=unclassified Janthinobacterium TaxID=2610881 RepID=UPI001611FF9F|nr:MULTISPECIES: hypothetical protein [unclassified Janthinobacterium]MBB5609337.1 hypothetical protein [Janthinobacterium sp. S3T4]MBB5614510.1 hypothetical protein [Janthinobacterium sp. S3M3]